jgi:hypothetical protein
MRISRKCESLVKGHVLLVTLVPYKSTACLQWFVERENTNQKLTCGTIWQQIIRPFVCEIVRVAEQTQMNIFYLI